MRYVGGKTRIAKHITEIILRSRGERTTYVEPFLGGASVFALTAPHFERSIGADVVPDLVEMWTAARDGWVPPGDLDEMQYQALRHADPSALRGFAGFGCSFGGKWFGGFARSTKPDGTPRNLPDEASRRIVERARSMRGSLIARADYRALSHFIDDDTVVYCDPPYAGTTGYASTPAWDAAAFWSTAREWASSGALVYVSEYAAPSDWVAIWEREHRQSLQGGSAPRPATVERLFALPETLERSGLAAL